ncbi:7tm 6 domain containing protein, partial [Asbolus verrucosus]
MEKFDWTVTIRPNMFILKLVGLWPEGDESYKFNLYTFYVIFSITIFVYGHNFTQALNILFVINDLEAVIRTIYISLTLSIAVIKTYCIIRNMKTLKQLMIIINSDIFQPKSEKQKKLVKSNLSEWKRFYNTKVSPSYEITYVYQCISLLFIATTNINIDFNSSLEYQNINFFRFTSDSNKFFNWIVFVQFFASAVSIALSLFQLTVVTPFSNEFYTYAIYGVAVIVEIFIYCWFDNEVELKSKKIPCAIFESDWTDASLTVKKKMVFFTMKCQTPIKLSALNLFYLSIGNFIT